MTFDPPTASIGRSLRRTVGDSLDEYVGQILRFGWVDGRFEAALEAVAPDDGTSDGCGCSATFHEPTGTDIGDHVVLVVDADDCPGRGDLASSQACRATVVRALTDRDADTIRTRSGGRERRYAGRAAALLLAAGRFRERVRFHEDRLADRVARDPLGAAREASGRAGVPKRIAAETGLEAIATEAVDDADAFRAQIGPSIAAARIVAEPPAEARLIDRWEVDTGAVIRLYEGTDALRTYHLTPPTADFTDEALATLDAARERLVRDPIGGDRAPYRAVRAVASAEDPVEDLHETLRRHTSGHGMLEHVFADERVGDATLTAPVTENPLRVVVDGERCHSNIWVPPTGAATLASRLRRASGRSFSRASPTLDATLETESGSVRVAATTPPASDGLSFTFRRGDPGAWTLARLVEVGTLTPAAAGLLSVAVEHGVSGLIAGGRGAGKTTMLGSLLFELPPRTRSLLIEDTPELPVDALAAVGRDVQRLRVGDGAEPSPRSAVRTALRLGSGALVVGEVRGEEAAALYEAMRVGAAGETVLGTIHGEDPEAVRERVVSDLGVPVTSFATTDLVVIVDDRRVETIAEVCDRGGEIGFEALFERTSEGLVASGRIDRGESHLIESVTGSSGEYAATREVIEARTTAIGRAVETRRLDPRRYVEGRG
ncbi:ATPase, T2SS/T4P/T4SS family [Halorubrum vacuolatum]|uniref:Type IV secretory pathway ATPase VirB11/Archaellum biosynthesis ATPase n=1 Tax=Halorubrum vacuolatum TaxID=63740 RepID=A0A238X343_HALVU|nr:ATPase, T2SS/T4P/T4SS family [Halorubrum vacuolatum]SNR53425.1 Type IV secretory pathway ATPase VirB11/Archaellum biosynthesis ATPase [Halorubrum vacuolatum]